MPAPVFAQIEFDKDDNPYDSGAGYIEKLQALNDNFQTCAQYIAQVELQVEQTSQPLAAETQQDRDATELAKVATQAIQQSVAQMAALVDDLVSTAAQIVTGESVFLLNPSTVTQDIVLPGGFNAVSAGPIMIGEGVTVTISDHSTWSIN